MILETTPPPAIPRRKAGPSTPLDHWIINTMQTDPRRQWTSRQLLEMQPAYRRYPLPRISSRLQVLTNRQILTRESAGGRDGYAYRLAFTPPATATGS